MQRYIVLIISMVMREFLLLSALLLRSGSAKAEGINTNEAYFHWNIIGAEMLLCLQV